MACWLELFLVLVAFLEEVTFLVLLAFLVEEAFLVDEVFLVVTFFKVLEAFLVEVETFFVLTLWTEVDEAFLVLLVTFLVETAFAVDLAVVFLVEVAALWVDEGWGLEMVSLGSMIEVIGVLHVGRDGVAGGLSRSDG